MSKDYDVAVVGGGLLGSAIAWGLGRLGKRVVVLDEGDIAKRASRANFALVWVQSKGLGMPAYTVWTVQASQAVRAAQTRSRQASGGNRHSAAGRRRARSDPSIRQRACPRFRTPAWSSRYRPACPSLCSAPRPRRSLPARRVWRYRPRRAPRPSCRAGQGPTQWRSRAVRRQRRQRHIPLT